MSASEKKNYTVKFYVDRTYEVEFDFHAPDQDTANQMAEDMANDYGCDDFLHDLIDDMKDNYQNGDIEKDGDPEETETSYACMQSRRVAAWCEEWEEQRAEEAAEDEDEEEVEQEIKDAMAIEAMAHLALVNLEAGEEAERQRLKKGDG